MMILVTILCYFAVLLLIARITGRKGGSNAAFFKGENQSPWYIVSFGMIGASISGVTFVSVPGMVRGMDMTYMQTVLGFFFGYMAVAHILLPLYYKLNLTSIYGYLGTRIGVRAYRTGSFFFLLSRMLGTAAKLYLVCLILHTYVFQEMHVPFWLIAVGSVALVWIYTHKSGIKTIVWTDTLQTFCLIAALIFIIYFTIQRLDLNFSGIVQTIQNSEHSRIFVFDDWISRQNFFKQFFSGIFIVIVMTGLDQDMMQKNLSCRNLREAQKNMYCYGFSFIPLNFLFLCLGILLIALAGQMQLELPAMNDDTNNFDLSQNKRVAPSDYGRVSCPVKKNTLIISRMNAPSLVGACGFSEKDDTRVYLPDRLWQVRFDNALMPEYAWRYLSTKRIKSWFATIATGTSSSMKNITKPQLKSIQIPFPSLEKQAETVRRIKTLCDKCNAACHVFEESIMHLIDLRTRLISDVVTGQVDVRGIEVPEFEYVGEANEAGEHDEESEVG